LPILEQITSKHVLTTHLETKARVQSLVTEFFLDIARKG